MKILQIGLGNFGRNHLRAWHEIGLSDHLYIAEMNQDLLSFAETFRFPKDRVSTDLEAFWNQVDVVDVVTGTDGHFALCQRALQDGKDVFVEKPMTLTSDEALELQRVVNQTGQIVQVGYYYRYHPASIWLKRQIDSGALGQIRYLIGEFMGFKRARNDIGVMHTDGIHFIDLFNWLLGSTPVGIYAVTRDHFNRGLEDMAIGLLTYPGEVVARVEAGYIQPGRWRDKVVAGAMTTKCITVIGSQRTVSVDFETEEVRVYNVHHELKNGVWTAMMDDQVLPNLGSASPLEQIKSELSDFINCVKNRRRPMCNEVESGINLALIIEALYRSGRERSYLRLDPTSICLPAGGRP